MEIVILSSSDDEIERKAEEIPMQPSVFNFKSFFFNLLAD
jgi:hypothetical protein